MKIPVFVNGFTSWLETHHEIVEFITTELIKDIPRGVIAERQEAQGHGGVYELGEEWTNEFEALHEGQDWEGQDYYDTLSDFLQEKNK